MSEVNLTHKGALEEGQIGIHRLSGLAPRSIILASDGRLHEFSV